ncbi:effector-associated domain EAD1-containing protein [Cylindrospermopsis raciborskii]|uniref:effector-associated domain EAD1-containing protein n=1 Tax=Cylindrospermopsis raciborskii TaxID=77022 RepID=UPI0022CC1294|nr:effector-associated domain EAD1-containing protein [Cylindrospermopsis raciborskii]MCZ2207667.1 effector-associated domain EAD1-containing protein [Cylindrospermopsis raciborskii PAMP2011]
MKSEFEELFEALLDAYRDYDQLKIMVRLKLGQNLEEISPQTKPIDVVVYELTVWAERSNKTLYLILGAYGRNRDNPLLKEITRKVSKRIIKNGITVPDDLKEEFFEVVNELDIKKDDPVERLAGQNQQQSNFNEHINFDESICDIDFLEAHQAFDKIESNFNKDGDSALFLLEKNIIRQGDLYLKKLKNKLKRTGNYREFFTTYTSGNIEGVIEKIGGHLDNIKPREMTLNEYIKLIIGNIGSSLQNNSVFFIEIKCDRNTEASEIDHLITWFTQYFWQPLQTKIEQVTKDFSGIKVIAVIISNIEINQNDVFFESNKLRKIPLADSWEKEDIFNWLQDYTQLRKEERDKRSTSVYNETVGRPRDVCYVLQQEWDELTKKQETK